MIAFFPALLPPFVQRGSSTFIVVLVLGLLFSSTTLLWLTGCAFAPAKAGDCIRRGRVRCMLEVATGVILITLGLRLSTESR